MFIHEKNEYNFPSFSIFSAFILLLSHRNTFLSSKGTNPTTIQFISCFTEEKQHPLSMRCISKTIFPLTHTLKRWHKTKKNLKRMENISLIKEYYRYHVTPPQPNAPINKSQYVWQLEKLTFIRTHTHW